MHAEKDANYWATHEGAEIDLVALRRGKLDDLECKFSDAASVSDRCRLRGVTRGWAAPCTSSRCRGAEAPAGTDPTIVDRRRAQVSRELRADAHSFDVLAPIRLRGIAPGCWTMRAGR
jgi:hypothetical protein